MIHDLKILYEHINCFTYYINITSYNYYGTKCHHCCVFFSCLVLGYRWWKRSPSLGREISAKAWEAYRRSCRELDLANLGEGEDVASCCIFYEMLQFVSSCLPWYIPMRFKHTNCMHVFPARRFVKGSGGHLHPGQQGFASGQQQKLLWGCVTSSMHLRIKQDRSTCQLIVLPCSLVLGREWGNDR